LSARFARRASSPILRSRKKHELYSLWQYQFLYKPVVLLSSRHVESSASVLVYHCDIFGLDRRDNISRNHISIIAFEAYRISHLLVHVPRIRVKEAKLF
jgi:hypothetical protein